MQVEQIIALKLSLSKNGSSPRWSIEYLDGTEVKSAEAIVIGSASLSPFDWKLIGVARGACTFTSPGSNGTFRRATVRVNDGTAYLGFSG